MSKNNHWDPNVPYNDLPPLPPKNFTDQSVSSELLREAAEALAELRGYTTNLPTSLEQLLNPLYLEEPLFSSKIENINTTLESVLEQQLAEEETKKSSSTADQKVLNYRKAIVWGWMEVGKQTPITQRLVEGLHKRLLPNERGGFRKEQNKIVNDTTGDIRYTSPNPTALNSFLSNWEQFINKNTHLHPLIVTAVAHYQFEAIHPFIDGNGRVGRMLIILQLIKAGVVNGPSIQISRYINTYRSNYYDLLLNVTAKEEWQQFVEFLLTGLKKEARSTCAMLMRLDKEVRNITSLLQSKAPKIYSRELVESIFSFPIINPTKLADVLNIHYQTASKYLRTLESLGVLYSEKRGRKKLYTNSTVFDIILKNSTKV